MSDDLCKWLDVNGFAFLADGLLEDFDTAAELANVTKKKILNLGGTDEDYRLLIERLAIALADAQRVAEQSLNAAQGEILAQLPVYIAPVYLDLLHEPHPRVRLHLLFDAAELLTRWYAALMISFLRTQNGGLLPVSLSGILADLIEKPTFGKWVGILRETWRTAKTVTDPTIEMLSLIDAIGASRTPSGSVRRLDLIIDVLSADRNTLAHSGGSLKFCSQSFDRHWPQIDQLMKDLSARMTPMTLAGICAGTPYSLKGLTATPIVQLTVALTDRADGVWLVGPGIDLDLWPLLRHQGLVTSQRPMAYGIYPQSYISTRKGKTLTFLPAVSDEAVSYIDDALFRDFFKLDVRPATLREQFISLAADDAAQLVGRVSELAEIQAWLASMLLSQQGRPNLGVVFGAPGMGKSILLASVLTQIDQSQWGAVYFHRFRRGNAGNTPDEFFSQLLGVLQHWPALTECTAAGQDRTGPERNRSVFEQVTQLLANLPLLKGQPRLLIVIDGLDEVTQASPEFPLLVKKLTAPGTVWLMSSRDEGRIAEQLESGSGMHRLAGASLPGLNDGDIRTMLMSLPGPVKYALARRDESAAPEDSPRNPFIDAIVRKSAGNPLYIRFLEQDLENQTYVATNEVQLPIGLTAYYERMMQDLQASDAARALPLIVALLACSAEPLSRESLQYFNGGPDDSQAVDDAIRGAGPMLRATATVEGAEAFTLYHTNFRDHVLQSPRIKGTITEARKKLTRATLEWQSLPSSLQRHLFRAGTAYCLEWGDDAILAGLYGRLTSIAYHVARMSNQATTEQLNIEGEYRQTIKFAKSRGTQDQVDTLTKWLDFFIRKRKVLQKGNAKWEAHKIFVQLAHEVADSSPVSIAVDQWLATGACTWPWLSIASRPAYPAQEGLVLVLNDDISLETQLAEYGANQLVSGDKEGVVALWDLESGRLLNSRKRHTQAISGIDVLNDGQVVSWSVDGTLRVGGFDPKILTIVYQQDRPIASATRMTGGAYVIQTNGDVVRIVSGDQVISTETDATRKLVILSPERFATWGGLSPPALWDVRSGKAIHWLESASDQVIGITAVDNARCATWTDAASEGPRLWDINTGQEIAALRAGASPVCQVIATTNGYLYVLHVDGKLRCAAVESGEEKWSAWLGNERFRGSLETTSGHLVIWDWSAQITCWDPSTGRRLWRQQRESDSIEQVIQLRSSNLVIASRTKIYGPQKMSVEVMDVHSGEILESIGTGMQEPSLLALKTYENRFLARSIGTAAIFRTRSDSNSSARKSPCEGIDGLFALNAHLFLTQSVDGIVSVWDSDQASVTSQFTWPTYLEGVLYLHCGAVILWSDEKWEYGDRWPKIPALMSWSDADTGKDILKSAVDEKVSIALAVGKSRFLTLSDVGKIRLWNANAAGNVPTELGDKYTAIGVRVLIGGQILTWTKDGVIDVWETDGAHSGRNEFPHVGISQATEAHDGDILSSAADGSIRRWDRATGKLSSIFQTDAEPVHLAFEGKRGQLISLDGANRLRCWDMSSQKVIFESFLPSDYDWSPYQLDRVNETVRWCQQDDDGYLWLWCTRPLDDQACIWVPGSQLVSPLPGWLQLYRKIVKIGAWQGLTEPISASDTALVPNLPQWDDAVMACWLDDYPTSHHNVVPMANGDFAVVTGNKQLRFLRAR